MVGLLWSGLIYPGPRTLWAVPHVGHLLPVLSVKAVKAGFETSENTWKVGGRLRRGWSGEKERMTHLLIRCQSTAIIPSSPDIIMVLPHFH